MRTSLVVCILFVHIFSCSVPVVAATSSEPIVGAVVFQGVTVFNPDQLGPVYQSSIGKKLNGQVRSILAAKVRQLYTERGFYAPSVTVSPHDTVAGVTLVQVTEPRVAAIEVRGADQAEARRIRQAFSPLQAVQPVSRRHVEYVVNSYQATHQVALASEPQATGHRAQGGGFTLVLRKQTHWYGFLSYSSEGDKRLGRDLVIGQVAVANPVPLVHQASVFGLHTLASDAYRVAGGEVVTAPGNHSKLTLGTRIGRALLDNPSAPGRTVYRFQEHGAEWSYGLDNTDQMESDVFAALTARSYTRTDRGTRELDEDLRLADIGYRALHQTTDRAQRLVLTGRAGIDGLGASRRGSQSDDGVDLSFQIARAEYTLWHRLPAGLSVRTLVEGQYATDHLPSSQKFVIGGSQFARAYEPGAFAGDRGAGAEVELRRRFANPWDWPAAITPFVYYGLATAEQHGTGRRDSAAAAGLGFRLVAGDLSGFLEYGRPLTNESAISDEDGRLTGRVTLTF